MKHHLAPVVALCSALYLVSLNVDRGAACAQVPDNHSRAGDSDWPHWRGPARNGVTAERSGWDGIAWLREKPLWSAEVGEGATSPLVVQERVYCMGFASGRDTVYCLEAATGREIWQASYPSRRHARFATGDEGLYSGPTSTPEFDSATGYLYTLSCDGELHCWDTRQDGRRVWNVNLYDAFHAPQRPRVGRSGHRDYGYTTSPLVHGDWLLVEAGSPRGNVVALEKRTGKLAWTSESKFAAGHAGGLAPLRVGDVPCAALLTYEGLLVVRLDGAHAGQTLAAHPWKTDFANNIATPATHGDSVVITSAYNQNAICRLRIAAGSRSAAVDKPEIVWKRNSLASKTCTPVIYQGRLYYAWDRLHCLDFQTGQTLWDGPRVGDAGSCIVTSDEKLIVWCQQGTLLLADLAGGGTQYRELARREVLGRADAWPHVVLARGRLYCKDRLGSLVCLQTVAAKP